MLLFINDTILRVNTTTKGKYVPPYTRTSKDSTQYNNFETKGNYNPYTHKYGTKTATH